MLTATRPLQRPFSRAHHRRCPSAAPGSRISICLIDGYPGEEEVDVAKTLIDVNEEYLAAAQAALHTETKKDTINAARRAVAPLAARQRDLQRLGSGGLPGLGGDGGVVCAWAG